MASKEGLDSNEQGDRPAKTTPLLEGVIESLDVPFVGDEGEASRAPTAADGRDELSLKQRRRIRETVEPSGEACEMSLRYEDAQHEFLLGQSSRHRRHPQSPPCQTCPKLLRCHHVDDASQWTLLLGGHRPRSCHN